MLPRDRSDHTVGKTPPGICSAFGKGAIANSTLDTICQTGVRTLDHPATFILAATLSQLIKRIGNRRMLSLWAVESMPRHQRHVQSSFFPFARLRLLSLMKAGFRRQRWLGS